MRLGASAKRELLVTKRSGPWEGERRQAKRTGEAPCRPYSLSRLSLRANFNRERDFWVRGSLAVRGTQENLFVITRVHYLGFLLCALCKELSGKPCKWLF